jgi:hypothetical protein
MTAEGNAAGTLQIATGKEKIDTTITHMKPDTVALKTSGTDGVN